MKLSRLLLIASSFLLINTTSLYAKGDKGIYGGLKLGATLNRLEAAGWDPNYKVGLNGGLFLGLRSGAIGLHGEVLYNQTTYTTGKTFKDFYSQYYNSIADSLKVGSFKVSTVSVPVLAQFKPISRVWIQAGPEFQMTIQTYDKDKLVQDAEAMFNRGAVNGIVGVWLQLTDRINVGGRYVFGLTNKNVNAIKQSWQDKVIQFHVGVNF